MKYFLAIGAFVFAAACLGCAGRQDPPQQESSIKRSNEQMSTPATVTELFGEWKGSNRLWVMPGDPVRESETTATVAPAVGGAVATISYTWSYEGKPQEGLLVVQAGSNADEVDVVWVDSWHTASKFMLFRDEEKKDGLVAVHGTYAAPPGPEWGWRILIGAESPDAMQILMYNVTPDGQEMLAVDARYHRVAAPRR